MVEKGSSLPDISGGQLPTYLILMIARQVKKQVYMQGMGRHEHYDVITIAKGDLKALSDYLGKAVIDPVGLVEVFVCCNHLALNWFKKS